MYDKEKINRLSLRYIETDDDAVFEELLKELEKVIDKQLLKYHCDIKEDWDDLKQRILLILWKNRKKIQETDLTPSSYFYYSIMGHGSNEKRKIKKCYDKYSSNVHSLSYFSRDEEDLD